MLFFQLSILLGFCLAISAVDQLDGHDLLKSKPVLKYVYGDFTDVLGPISHGLEDLDAPSDTDPVDPSAILAADDTDLGPLPLLDENCVPIPKPRILTWDKFHNYIARPNKNWPWRHEKYGDEAPISTIDLQLSGDGYVWVEDLGEAEPFHTQFDNSQKWKLVNCTNTFAEATIERGGCTSGDLALYSDATDIEPGETVYNRGTIGTTRDIAYPQRSAWSVYTLKGFSITPVSSEVDLTGKSLVVEIRAWDETGTFMGLEKTDIVGGEAGYRIELDAKIFRRVMKWQVHIRQDTDGEPQTTDFFALIIDDVDIVEYIYDSKTCPVYIPEHTTTERTLDLTLPILPAGYIFDPNTTYYASYERAAAKAAARHRRDRNKNLGSPKGFYSIGQIDIIATASLFDPVSVKIRIDPSTLPKNISFNDLSLSTETHVTTYDRSMGGYVHVPLEQEFNNVQFDPDGVKGGLKKLAALQLMPVPTVGYWIEEIVVKEWNEWPGTYRCGTFQRLLCEWPKAIR